MCVSTVPGSRTIQFGQPVLIDTVAGPGVTTGSGDEGAAVTSGPLAVPGVTRGGVLWILRDVRSRVMAGPRDVRARATSGRA
jgi:hypothetical protein